MNYEISSPSTRRRVLWGIYVLVWIGGSVAIGIPIMGRLAGFLIK